MLCYVMLCYTLGYTSVYGWLSVEICMWVKRGECREGWKDTERGGGGGGGGKENERVGRELIEKGLFERIGDLGY